MSLWDLPILPTPGHFTQVLGIWIHVPILHSRHSPNWALSPSSPSFLAHISDTHGANSPAFMMRCRIGAGMDFIWSKTNHIAWASPPATTFSLIMCMSIQIICLCFYLLIDFLLTATTLCRLLSSQDCWWECVYCVWFWSHRSTGCACPYCYLFTYRFTLPLVANWIVFRSSALHMISVHLPGHLPLHWVWFRDLQLWLP